MRKYILLACFVICVLSAKISLAQESFSWKEMGAFHSTAMLSFHGAEDGKLQPTRDSAAAMLLKVNAWQASTIPAGHNAAAVKTLLQTLAAECAAITSAVAGKKTDADLKPLVLKAHHTFHKIIEQVK